MDNLESQTYEVFEKDPIKYSQYQQVRAQPLLRLGGVLRLLLLEQDRSNYDIYLLTEERHFFWSFWF